jgi:hypothetical protein
MRFFNVIYLFRLHYALGKDPFIFAGLYSHIHAVQEF